MRSVSRHVVGCLLLLAAMTSPAEAIQADEFSDEAVVIESMRVEARFDDDGTGRIVEAARVRVLTPAAVAQFGQLAFGYSAANESLTVSHVRVEKADGRVVVAPPSAVQDLTGAVAREAPVYSDYREMHVTVPGLRPGEMLEYRIVRDVFSPLAAGHFWMHHDFVTEAPVLEETLVVDVPARRTVTVATRSGAEPEKARVGDRVRYRWRREQREPDRELPAVFWRQPPPDVSVTTFGSWEAVGAWYRELQTERVRVTPAIRERAEALVAGRVNAADTVRALYDYVSREFRYVSLSFGLGRVQPHFAGEVLSNQYGDCKDKHTLLAALLSAVGRDAYPALAQSLRLVDSTAPSPGQFDHVVTVVPFGDSLVWLDTTTEIAPFGLLLPNLRGKQALVVSPSAAALDSIPADPPFPSSELVTVVGRLDAAGRLDAEVRFSLRGDAEVLMRSAFRHTPRAQWGQLLEATVKATGLPGSVAESDVSDPEDTSRPFELQVGLAGSESWSGAGLELAVPLPGLSLDVMDDDAIGRDSVIHLGQPSEWRQDLRLNLGPGIRARRPMGVDVERDYAVYRSRYTVEDSVFVVRRTLSTLVREVPVRRRTDLAAFARAMSTDQNQILVLERDLARVPSVAESAEVDELHAAGYAALENGEYDEARRLFTAVVAQDSVHMWAWNNLGRAYLNLGQLDSAEFALRKQIAINPYDEYAHNNLGLVLWRRRRHDDAIAAFRQQIAVNPFDEYAHGNLGRLLARVGRFTEALPSLRRAVSLDSDDARLWLALGRVELEVGDPDSAFAALSRAVELEPMTPSIANDAAYALAEHGVRVEQARTWAELAVRVVSGAAQKFELAESRVDKIEQDLMLVGELASFWDTLGWIYFKLGRLDDAERYLGAAWLLGQRSVIGDHLGQLHERRGRTAQARQTYARAFAAGNPSDGLRDRLARMSGGPQEMDRLVGDAARELLRLRTVEVPVARAGDASGLVALLVGSDAKVRDALVIEGGSPLQRVADALRGTSVPVTFPENEELAVIRLAIVACAEDVCDISLFKSGSAPSFLRDRMRQGRP